MSTQLYTLYTIEFLLFNLYSVYVRNFYKLVQKMSTNQQFVSREDPDNLTSLEAKD